MRQQPARDGRRPPLAGPAPSRCGGGPYSAEQGWTNAPRARTHLHARTGKCCTSSWHVHRVRAPGPPPPLAIAPDPSSSHAWPRWRARASIEKFRRGRGGYPRIVDRAIISLLFIVDIVSPLRHSYGSIPRSAAPTYRAPAAASPSIRSSFSRSTVHLASEPYSTSDPARAQHYDHGGPCGAHA